MITIATEIRICGVFELSSRIAQHRPDAVISIGAEDEADFVQTGLRGYNGPVVRLQFHDVDRVTRGTTAPALEHFEELQRFLDAIPLPRQLLVHCAAGISRSPATACFAMAHLQLRQGLVGVPSETVGLIFDKVVAAAPHCDPNERILRIAEQLMPEYGRGFRPLARRRRDAEKGTVTVASFTW